MTKQHKAKSSLLRLAVAGVCAVGIATVATGQSTTASQTSSPFTIIRDPQALVLLAKAEAALAGSGASATDVTVQASVHWIKGADDETVSATFTSAGPETSQTTFNLPAGTLTELRAPSAAISTNAGVKQTVALHNTLNMHEWFFPQFFLKDLQQNAGYSLSVSVPSAENDASQITIQGSLIPAGVSDPGTAQIVSDATQFVLVLDAATSLPVSLSFTGHPEDDALRGFPVLYSFSQYQTQNGMQQPFHIRKFVQGTLTLDVTVQSFAVNSGLTPSQFSVE